MSDIHERLQNNKLIVFDKGGNVETLKSWNIKEGLDRPSTWWLYGLVGPEWGRWPKDYELFKKYTHEVKDLWATVLRMETAAIIGAWVLKNLL
jgi:16S rRNA U1498 N3-methylase RsmE